MSILNRNQLALTLTAASASANGHDLENMSCKGAHFTIDVTAITGTTPTVTVTIEGKDEFSGKYYTILASSAISTVSTTVLKVYPALTAAANSVANDIVPKMFRVRATIAGTGPAVTATVGVSLVE